MSPWSKVGAGVFFFFVGMGYLSRPDVIERVMAVLRDILLNDAHITLDRRKWGVFFLLLSVLFLYMGYLSLYPVR
jgi:hypothetical protein